MKYTQIQIIGIFNKSKTALELLQSRELLEDTGHTLHCQAMIVYNTNMTHHYETNTIA